MELKSHKHMHADCQIATFIVFALTFDQFNAIYQLFLTKKSSDPKLLNYGLHSTQYSVEYDCPVSLLNNAHSCKSSWSFRNFLFFQFTYYRIRNSMIEC